MILTLTLTLTHHVTICISSLIPMVPILFKSCDLQLLHMLLKVIKHTDCVHVCDMVIYDCVLGLGCLCVISREIKDKGNDSPCSQQA